MVTSGPNLIELQLPAKAFNLQSILRESRVTSVGAGSGAPSGSASASSRTVPKAVINTDCQLKSLLEPIQKPPNIISSLGPLSATAASSSLTTSSLVPDRVQSSEESSPGQGKSAPKGKKEKKTQKEKTQKEKSKKQKKKAKEDDDDDEESADADHEAAGCDEDDDDNDDLGLEGYNELLGGDGTRKQRGKGETLKRPAAKRQPTKRPSKKCCDDWDQDEEVWGWPKQTFFDRELEPICTHMYIYICTETQRYIYIMICI